MLAFARAKAMVLMVRNGEVGEILGELTHRMYSDEASVVLRRDLMVPLIPRPIPKIPFSIRPLRPSDIAYVVRERPRRLPVLLADIPTCYVAVTPGGSICYMQWLVRADQQSRLLPYFKGELAQFGEDTVLLEFAYTFKKFRGAGIMGAAMAEIAEQAIHKGTRWALTYVRNDNIPSLKGCAKAGFRPCMLRSERWRAFRLSQSFMSIDAKDSSFVGDVRGKPDKRKSL